MAPANQPNASAAAVALPMLGKCGAPMKHEESFAAGMYVTLWPKVERCHGYVSVLLAAQEQLQETIEGLLACMFSFFNKMRLIMKREKGGC